MLFDPRPKTRREELFDREEELEELIEATKKYPLTLLLGIRRIGKSSILRVALNELNGIYIDARELYFESGGWISSSSLKKAIERSLNATKPKWRKELAEILKRIEGVKVSGLEIKLSRESSLTDVLLGLNEIGAVIAIDEAQYLRFYGARGGKEFLALVAYAYDNLENLSFVFSGSEVGLLHDFLRIDDYTSPLYGRAYEEVTVEPFSRDLSKEFLKSGFEEAEVRISEGEIEKAVEFLDGIPGWLVEFGYSYIHTKNFKEAMEKVLRKAEAMILGEIKELEKKSPRYSLILKAISLGLDRWELIKEYIEVRAGEVPNSRLASLLRNLEKMGWVKKEEGRYRIIDPVVREVISKAL
ncbi:AAA family ATPase [Pyrococcus kukulkanii]|uniref:ATP-binding protein n=1 Tax=Pyrococcus kukulkanii TaxID=1609559 RepID=A0ABV4T1U9_9EURY